MSILLTVLTTALLASTTYKLHTWRTHYLLALTSSFPTYLTPVHLLDIWWLLLGSTLAPIISLLPSYLHFPWLPLTQVGNIWKAGHSPFATAGSDNLMLSSPRGNLLFTADPSVISQILHSHKEAQTPVEMLAFHDIYGPTLITTEGEEWAFHRRVIAGAFGAETNPRVWAESVRQAEGMLEVWIGEGGGVVGIVREWTSRLSLHIASGIFFDRPLGWERKEGKSLAGCTLSYTEALFGVLDNLDMIFHMPRWLLRNLPFKAVRDANLAFVEWTRYLEDLRDGAVERMEEIVRKKDRSMLESVVLAGNEEAAEKGARRFTPGQVIGNIFLTLHGGHHTTGNTLWHALTLLALHPRFQEPIQKELDEVLGDREQSEWSAEQDFNALFRGKLGAALRETQRLYSVVQFLPRQIVADLTVTDSKGQAHVIPQDTFAILDFAAAFQHEQYWDRANLPGLKRDQLHNSPALDFDPTRWETGGGAAKFVADDAPMHFPFGQGRRACPGQAFAQTEMIAVLATILKQYKLELFVSDEVFKGNKVSRDRAWAKARHQGFLSMIDDIKFNTNIYLDKSLPFRLVPRNAADTFDYEFGFQAPL